ncbi:MAG: tRNA (adenosine(37)-N6)-dimethylallyltransferase MiaA [Eubacteriales bacterium]|nr:tRNA (adenosine(37)-N6)-dimethylallyltransferase MiaA [Eubacteriales bacterium]
MIEDKTKDKAFVLVITGPTASGKSEAAVNAAIRLNGEIISADSMQVYKHMNIGTAKLSDSEMRGIKHHMLDFADPRRDFSVAEYQKLALEAIRSIMEKGKTPIISGGTGLYISSVTEMLSFSGATKNDAYRSELEDFAKVNGTEMLHSLLAQKDPEIAASIHHNNLRRVIRALEILNSDTDTRPSRAEPEYRFLIYCLDPDRKQLYARIDARVSDMLSKGLEKEVRSLLKLGVTCDSTAMQAIGYKELAKHIHGEITLEGAVNEIKRRTRLYAKRQMTWFRRMHGIIYVKADINKGNYAIEDPDTENGYIMSDTDAAGLILRHLEQSCNMGLT